MMPTAAEMTAMRADLARMHRDIAILQHEAQWRNVNMGHRVDPTQDDFMIRITVATPTNGSGTGHATDPSTQWLYTALEVIESSAGYDGWITKVGGWTGYAYNGVEDLNTNIVAATPGILGCGIDLSNLDYNGDGTFEFYPVPYAVGAVTSAKFRAVVGAAPAVWFEKITQIDGACAA